MNPGWIIFGLCALTLIGATLPLLYERRTRRRRDDNAPPNQPPAKH